MDILVKIWATAWLLQTCALVLFVFVEILSIKKILVNLMIIGNVLAVILGTGLICEIF